MGKFLRLAINDDYNLNMNNVDIADQLQYVEVTDQIGG